MILGISPGTSRFGFAVLRNKELIHWGTKVFCGKWNKRKLKWILNCLERLITEYGVTQIAVKYPDYPPTTKEYNQLIGAMNVLMESKFVTIQYYPLKQLKRYFGNGHVISKRDVFSCLWSEYPELVKRKHISTLANLHYAKLLEAIATAHVHLNTESLLMQRNKKKEQ